MTTASITLPRTASNRTVTNRTTEGVGPITAFWTEMLAAWARTNEIEFRIRSGR